MSDPLVPVELDVFDAKLSGSKSRKFDVTEAAPKSAVGALLVSSLTLAYVTSEPLSVP